MIARLSIFAALLVAAIALHVNTGPVSAAACDDGASIRGNLPPASGGWGQFTFCGGTFDELLTTSECPEESAVFFFNKPDGTFAVWVPGSDVEAVNNAIKAVFAGAIVSGPLGDYFASTIPSLTIFTARC